MSQYLTIKDNPNLARECSSMGIVNTNRILLESAKRKRLQALAKVDAEERRNSEINMLRQEVNELKVLIKQLLSAKEQ